MAEQPSLTEQIFGGRGPGLTTLLETLAEAVTIRDLTGTLVYANRAALDQIGFDSLAALQAQPSSAIMDEYLVYDEHGRPLTMDDVPSIRLLRGEPATPLLLHAIHPRTGRSRWQLLKADGLSDRDGRLIAAVTVIEDVTAVKSAEVRMRILSEAGRVLVAAPGLRHAVENIAQIAVPELADWCVVDLISQDLRRERSAVAHRDAARRHDLQRMRELEPECVDPESTIGRVFTTGEPALFHDVPDSHLMRVSGGGEHLRILRGLRTRSALAVPLRAGPRIVGVMTACTAHSRRRLTDDDVDLAAQLANRAATAVENARLHEMLTGVAATLQQSLRPAEIPPVPGWEVAGLYRPAGDSLRIEVGGDFYEVIVEAEGSLAVIGDVTGHGVTAATVTALLRHGARFAARFDAAPGAVLGRLDEALRRQPGAPLCTALCARLDDGAITLSSAGHPPALIVSAAGGVRELPDPGPLLGAFEGVTWAQQRVEVEPGELVLLYTDGVTEAAGRRDRYGSERLRRLLAEHAGRGPQRVLDALETSLIAFGDGARRDDVAALALTPVSAGRRRPPEAGRCPRPA